MLALAPFAGIASTHPTASSAAEPVPAARSRPSSATASAARPDLAALAREFAELRGADLEARFAQVLAEAPVLARDALLWRAGASLPFGVPADQREYRRVLRAEARALIERRMNADPLESALWRERVATLLEDSKTPDGLWAAAARTAASLSLFEAAPRIAAGLDSARPRREVAARRALFVLYGRWLSDRGAFETLGGSAVGCHDPALRETLRQRDQLAQDRLAALLELDPARGLGLLEDVDPRTRAAAAAALARGVAASTLERNEAIEALADRLEREADPAAFDAALSGLLDLVGGFPPEHPMLGRLRDALAARVDPDWQHLTPSVVHGLAALPWRTDSTDGPASLARAAEWLDIELEELTVPGRLVEPDALVAALQASRTTLERAQREGLSLEGAGETLRAVVVARLDDPSEAPSVRSVCGRVLASIAGPEDVERVALVLDDPNATTELRYNLLGTLARLAADLPPTDPRAIRARARLEKALSDPVADLRSRALGLLLSEPMRPLVRRSSGPRLVQRLAEETNPELRGQLLELLALAGGPKDADALLDGPAFESLVQADPALRTRLVATLTTLVDGDAVRRVRIARRLLALDDPTSRVRRLQQALELVAALDPQAARSLAPADHADIVRWARELRAASGGPLALPEDGTGLLHQLIEIHVPGASAAQGQPDAASVETLALFLADLYKREPEAVAVEEVLARFDEALALARERPDGALSPGLVLRDRARFLVAAGDADAALADYRAAIEQDRARTPEEGAVPGWLSLDLSDLRTLADLLAREGTPAAAREAAGVLERLLARPAWRQEPPAVRLQDLRRLTEHALASADPDLVSAAREFLAGLPPLPAEGAPPPVVDPSRPFSDLVADRATHAALLEFAARLGEPGSKGRSGGTPEPPGSGPPTPDGGGPTDGPSEGGSSAGTSHPRRG